MKRNEQAYELRRTRTLWSRPAYMSDKTGIAEVYLRPFPGPGPEVPDWSPENRGRFTSHRTSPISSNDTVGHMKLGAVNRDTAISGRRRWD
jgi:hypothetical protein